MRRQLTSKAQMEMVQDKAIVEEEKSSTIFHDGCAISKTIYGVFGTSKLQYQYKNNSNSFSAKRLGRNSSENRKA